jgi:hypothetical protein
MARKPKDPVRSLAALRRGMRGYRQTMGFSAILGAISTAGLVLCLWLRANSLWSLVCGLGIMSAVIQLLADLNRYCKTKRRVEQLSQTLEQSDYYQP